MVTGYINYSALCRHLTNSDNSTFPSYEIKHLSDT